jgi:hypothetical protein
MKMGKTAVLVTKSMVFGETRRVFDSVRRTQLSLDDTRYTTPRFSSTLSKVYF